MERYASYPSLMGRHVLITGGATGIGESFVSHFHQQGARVSFLDIAKEAGESLANKLGEGARRTIGAGDVRRNVLRRTSMKTSSGLWYSIVSLQWNPHSRMSP